MAVAVSPRWRCRRSTSRCGTRSASAPACRCTGCFRGAGGDGMIEKALHFVKQGYKAIKMQVAHVHTPAEDLDNVRRMREALGPDIDIMIDVNMGWSADVAIEMGRKFERYDIYWLEGPVPADDLAGDPGIAPALDMRVGGGG